MKRNKNFGFNMVCVSKKKSGLPINIWLESMAVNKLNREGIIYFQNNYRDTICLDNELIPINILNTSCDLKCEYDINIKSDDVQMILKYVADNAGIFLKHWNGDIDDQDVLNLLFSQEKYNKMFSKQYNDQSIDYGILCGTDKKVVLIKTGQNGSIYGYGNKYIKMAKNINQKYGSTVVVSSNPYDCTDSLGHALEVIKEEVNQDVDVYFIGMSNGAILGARFGHSHLEIKRMLLINGPLMINWPKTKRGLEQFEGECVTMVYGSLDPSYKYAEMVEFIDNPGKIRLVKYEGADHNFKNMDELFQSLPEEYLFKK